MRHRLLDLMAEKQAREQRLITPAIMAKEMGMSRQYIHKWLSDEMASYRKDMIDAFCEYFNCEPGDLIVRVKDTPQLEPAG